MEKDTSSADFIYGPFYIQFFWRASPLELPQMAQGLSHFPPPEMESWGEMVLYWLVRQIGPQC